MSTRTRAFSALTTHTWADVGAIVLLCVLSLVLYRQIAFTNQILSGTDAMTYFFPYRAYAAQEIRSGSIPLWNPYLFLGAPFLANPQTAVFYPLNLLLVGLAAPKQVAWSLVIHSALAGTLAYAYARRVLSLSPLAACLAAAAFGQGGYLAAQAEHVNQVNVLAWFPLLLLLWEARSRNRWLALSGLAVTIALGLLAGHTQATYISLAGLTLYAVSTGLCRGLVEPLASASEPSIRSVLVCWLRSLFGVAWQLGLVVLVAFGLAAVQMLPTLELSRLSIRSRGLEYRQAVAFSLSPLPRLLRYTFLPVWRPDQSLGVLFGGEYYTEYLSPIGYLPLFFALLACGQWVWRLLQGLGSLEGGLRSGAASLRGWFSACEGDWLHESRHSLALIVLGGTGVFLALGLYNPFYWLLYKLVPGFGLFRVPARWLFLYSFSAAMLAGLGLQRLRDRLSPAASRVSIPRINAKLAHAAWSAAAFPALTVLLGVVELLLAAQHLPLNQPTAPDSFSSLRTAPAHILAAQAKDAAPGRFLSMSDAVFDPGDLGEITQIYQDQLTAQTLYGYIINIKRQEILAPNLPLAWRIYAIDGYDGGVLPLERYIRLQRLLLDEDDILADGRLREGLTSIPSSRLLSILGAEYVITDKVNDAWIGDTFYDLAFGTVLATNPAASLSTDWVQTVSAVPPPRHTATTLGIVSHLQNAQSVVQGTPVARVNLTMRNKGRQEARTFLLLAGQDTAEALYQQAAHNQAKIGRQWQTEPGTLDTTGYDYVTELSWKTPREILRIDVTALPFDGQLYLRGLALIDERDASSTPLLLTSRGHFEQVHSGDVKIYRAVDALPRAYAVHQAIVLEDDAQAIAEMKSPTFAPSLTVILHKSPTLDTSMLPQANTTTAQSRVEVLLYRPQEIILLAELEHPGYVVLSDTWYPGWFASLDGQEAPIERANLAFRAVYVPQGTHHLRFTYRPASYVWGKRISLSMLLILVASSLVPTVKSYFRHPDA